MGSLRYAVSVGERFNRLMVASEVYTRLFGKRKSKFRCVDCMCDCGNRSFGVSVSALVTGKVLSCGCHRREVTTRRNLKHGMAHRGAKDPLHGVWSTMKTRCYNPNSKSYRDYGARGVTICDEWRDDFKAFAAWAIDTGYVPRKLTIERIDYDKGYSPDNCKWITKGEQNLNTRQNVRMTAFGETKCLAEWSKDPRCVVCYVTLCDRLKHGIDPVAALTQPAHSGVHYQC